jgi:predicted transcriptional regulator
MKPTTVRIDNETLGRIDEVANTLSRSRFWVINQAIEKYLDYEEWFIQEVKEGLKEVSRGEIASDEDVNARFRKWGVNES